MRLSAVLALGALAAAAPAQAADFNCDASALRLTLATLPDVEPVTANRGAPNCQDASGPAATDNPLFTGSVLTAETRSFDRAQRASARGGVGSFSLKPLLADSLPALPTGQAIDALAPVTVPIGPDGQLLGLPSQITVDVRPALRSLTTLPAANLLDLEAVTATARAECVGSRASLSGSSTIGTVTVLGQRISVDGVVHQVQVVDGSTVDLSKLDLSEVELPPGLSFTDPVLGVILQNAVSAALAAAPPIELPASVLSVTARPGEQIEEGSGLTKRALRLNVALAGNQLLDLVVGEARVSDRSVSCGSSASAPANAALDCTTRKLVLIDVLDRGRHVKILGVADARYVGRRVSVFFSATGRRVGRFTVGRRGFFRGRVPLPPPGLEENRIRYYAQAGRGRQRERSLNLKLHRRMIVERARAGGERIRFAGRVTLPLTSPRSWIHLRQRVSCGRERVVARVRPDRRGRFAFTVAVPRRGHAVALRATTKVHYRAPDYRPGMPHSRKRFDTYTLPRFLALPR